MDQVSVNDIYCKEKTRMEVSFLALSNPRVFELKFSSVWDVIFKDLENNIDVKIANIDSSANRCTKTNESSSIFVKCSYKKVSQGVLLSLLK